MKIGVDLDGVVIDSEKLFRTYQEIYAIEDLKGRRIVNLEEPKLDRYDWTKEEQQGFIEKYLFRASKECDLMPGFLVVYPRLRKLGHKFVVVTARGGKMEEMKNDAIQLFSRKDISFDQYFWDVHDKASVCKQEGIDIMIDDDYKIIEQLRDAEIRSLYFRDANIKRLEESEYVHEVNNWGDVYRTFSEKGPVKVKK